MCKEYSTKFYNGQKVQVIDGFERFKTGTVTLRTEVYGISVAYYVKFGFFEGCNWIREEYLEAI